MKQILLITSCIALLTGCATASAGTGNSAAEQTQAPQPAESRTWQQKVDDRFAGLCAVSNSEVQDLRLWLMNEAKDEIERATSLRERLKTLASDINKLNLTAEQKQKLNGSSGQIAAIERDYGRYMGELKKVVKVRNPRRNCKIADGGPMCLNTYWQNVATSIAAVENTLGVEGRESLMTWIRAALPVFKYAVTQVCKAQLRRDMEEPRNAVEELRKFDFSEAVEI